MRNFAFLSTLSLLLLPASLLIAQEYTPPVVNQYEAERSAIETILSSVVDIVKDAANLSNSSDARSRLLNLSDQLTGSHQSFATVSTREVEPASDPEESIRMALAEIQAIRSDLTRKGDLDTSKRLGEIDDLLVEALEALQNNRTEIKLEPTNESRSEQAWLEPGEYSSDTADDSRVVDAEPAPDFAGNEPGNDFEESKELESDDDWEWRTRRWDDYDRHDFLETYVGEFTYRWPFAESAVYRTTPAIRYNRVEGLVLGVRRQPLEWDSYERGRIYGSGGYAFGSDRWQYEIGAEGRLGRRYGDENIDLKIGGSYRRATYTDDLWKSTWAENSLAAFFFNYDFFDYYQTEGWTGYATARLTPFSQVTVAYRAEDYSSLNQETTWSLFGGDNFRFNPPVDSGRVQSVVIALEGGEVKGLHHLPHGLAFRGEAELSKGFGGDFDYNRYTGDLRTYVRTSRRSSLGARLRGGFTDGDAVPVQKGFTIGGIGSVRAHAQNAYYGSRVVIFNAEYAMVQGWLWDELLIAGFFDAGWTNASSNEFAVDNMLKTAGVGFGLFDRTVRLDLAFPLDDFAGDKDPTLWLRVSPAF